MITETFDITSQEIISPPIYDNTVKCDTVIVTFSNLIEEYVVNKFKATKINEFTCVNGTTPIYTIEYNNKIFGFYKTILGSAASVGMM